MQSLKIEEFFRNVTPSQAQAYIEAALDKHGGGILFGTDVKALTGLKYRDLKVTVSNGQRTETEYFRSDSSRSLRNFLEEPSFEAETTSFTGEDDCYRLFKSAPGYIQYYKNDKKGEYHLIAEFTNITKARGDFYYRERYCGPQLFE